MRPTTWGLENGGFSALAAGSITVIDLGADLRTILGVNHLQRYTITHMIGTIFFRADAVPSSDVVQEIAFGIAVFPDSMPGANHPTPRSDNYDWMWQETLRWVPWTVEASAGVFRQLMNSVPFETKTQRVMKGMESRLELVVHNVTGEAKSADIHLRNLWRLP